MCYQPIYSADEGGMYYIMESKIILYDSNDIKIGETFARRARQLVKQQRAAWINDSHDSIRFAPGMEKMDDSDIDEVYEKHTPHPIDLDNKLLKLAKRRVHARFALRLHRSIVIVLCVFFVVLYMLTDMGGYFWPVWPTLGLGLSVAIHWVISKMVNSDSMSNEIIYEYEQLKHRHSYRASDRSS